MRRPEKAVTENTEIEKILRQGRICQLAFHAEPVPYLVSLNYGYADGALYFHSALEGRKIDLARQGTRVAFTVALELELISAPQACGWTTRFASVVGSGYLEFFETSEDKRWGLDRLMAHYTSGPFEYRDKAFAKTAVYRLVIDEMSAKRSQV